MSSEGSWHFFWCIWSCLPAPFLSPTPAATGCVVPIAPSPAPFSLLQEEVTVDTFSVQPLMNAGKSTVFFTSRSRHSSALPWHVCINYLCLSSLTFLAQCSWQTNKTDGIQWRQSEMERSDFPVTFTPSTLFQHYWVCRAISWKILVWDQNQEAHAYISGQKVKQWSTINVLCCFRAMLIQAPASDSDIFFTLKELKNLGILSALFTLKHEESMNI